MSYPFTEILSITEDLDSTWNWVDISGPLIRLNTSWDGKPSSWVHWILGIGSIRFDALMSSQIHRFGSFVLVIRIGS